MRSGGRFLKACWDSLAESLDAGLFLVETILMEVLDFVSVLLTDLVSLSRNLCFVEVLQCAGI